MKTKLPYLVNLLALLAGIHQAAAQGTAFTYEGRLNDGPNPATGIYDLQFTIYDSTNIPGNLIAGPLTNAAVSVTNGLFTVLLDFGGNVFTGPDRWLEISVRTNGIGAFATLSPRQLVTPAPYALYANSAASLESGGLRGLKVVALAPTPSYSNVVNLVAGSPINIASGNAATVAGGGASINGFPFPNVVVADMGTIGGGAYNTVISGFGTVGGGWNNQAMGPQSCTVSGGTQNTASGDVSTVGGGGGNVASGDEATVSGGNGNQATAHHSTVPGGSANVASGAYSFAAGQQAQALHPGCFVWADSQNAVFTSTNSDSFNVRAQGGARFVTSGAGLTVDGQLIVLSTNPNTFTAPQTFNNAIILNSSGGFNQSSVGKFSVDAPFKAGGRFVVLTNGNVGISNIAPGHLLVVGSTASPAYCDGTTWVNGSDRNSKEDFTTINPCAVLDKVSALPITEWKYKTEAPGTEHIGPMAQDFHEAFGLNGPDDKHIATVDEEGVALAAIQGLNQKLKDKNDEIQTLKRQNDSLAERLNELEVIVQGLAARK